MYRLPSIRRLLTLSAQVLLICLACHPRFPAFPLAAATAGTAGSVGGTVTSAVSGMPLAFADVHLLSAAGIKITSTKSDRRGRFLISGVPPGEYRLSAGRRYFATGRYGQQTWNGIGDLIAVAEGKNVEVEITLHRLGVITGMVLDENGEGMPNFPVRAIRALPDRPAGPVSYGGISDDRGYFRIPGLKPGKYYVASSENGAPDGGNYLPTYHPGVLDRSSSPPVEVEIDSETPGIAVRAIAGELLTLSGVVKGPAGGMIPPEVSLHLFLDEKRRDARPLADGSFQFRSLSPGRYTLAALSETAGAPALAAYQHVDLFQNLAGLSVDLAPAPELSLTLDAGPGAALQPGQILILLSRVENYGRSAPKQAVAAGDEAHFESGPLLPGEWRPFLVLPEDFYLDDILVEGKSSLAGIALLPGNAKAARIRLGHDPGLIKGRVLDDKGRIVPAAFAICYPLDERNRLRLAGYRKMQTNEKGEYRFGGLPPGSFRVAAVSFVPDELEDQLPDLMAESGAIRIESGSKIERDLVAGR